MNYVILEDGSVQSIRDFEKSDETNKALNNKIEAELGHRAEIKKTPNEVHAIGGKMPKGMAEKTRATYVCPICGINVKRLKRHLNKMHTSHSSFATGQPETPLGSMPVPNTSRGRDNAARLKKKPSTGINSERTSAHGNSLQTALPPPNNHMPRQSLGRVDRSSDLSSSKNAPALKMRPKTRFEPEKPDKDKAARSSNSKAIKSSSRARSSSAAIDPRTNSKKPEYAILYSHNGSIKRVLGTLLCPFCCLRVEAALIAGHVERLHRHLLSSTNDTRSPHSGSIACPFCGKSMATSDFAVHLVRNHRSEIKAKSAQEGRSQGSRGSPNLRSKCGADPADCIMPEAKEDFALKGLGHMRRESDGKFGSMPLFDDYDN